MCEQTSSIWVCVLLEIWLVVVCVAGPVCGKLAELQKNVTLVSNEVIITFMSGPHLSGRGFLLSYTTDQYPGMRVICAH